MRLPSLIVGLVLGACAGTAATTVATSEAPPPPPNEEIAKQESKASGVVTAGGAHMLKVAPSGKASITLLARGENAFLGKLEMDGGGKVPEHRDATEEYLYVVEGSGTLTMDDKDYDIGPGTTIYMPAGAKVSYANGKEQLVAIQVFAGPEPAAKYDGWTPKAP